MPRVGGAALVTHFGGGREPGVVTAISEGGRRLSVDTESGERFEFVLSRSTAKFVPVGSAQGTRLELLGP